MGKDLLILIALVVLALSVREALAKKQSYVVYLGGIHDEVLDHQSLEDSHYELLGSVLESKEAAKNSIFYTYSRCLNGFAAVLDEERARALSNLPEVLSVFPNRPRKLHTTDSWRFLGLEEGDPNSPVIPKDSLWTKAGFGKDIIVANLDTGVWPESASFHDTGLGPIPSRWKGSCQSGANFSAANCNRKLIGARYFSSGHEAANGPLSEENIRSPRDTDGHGSHTLSTAGGNFVKNASLYGSAEGTAQGGAPLARVVAYKVCWTEGCYHADILAGFDAGIRDGVDVFSVSLGKGPPRTDYFKDAVAIGGFHAVQLGKVVICSAGNSGPESGTVSNVAPWIITVGASTTDRKIIANALLGNNKTYEGSSASQLSLQQNKLYPLVSAADVKTSGSNEVAGKACFVGALDPQKVKGKIVACLRGGNGRIEKGVAVKTAGGAGMILCNVPENGNDIITDPHVLPAINLNAIDGAAVIDYINSTKSPVANISPPKTILNAKPNPVVAQFSSIGPNSLTPDILKPDITAPGVNILAAWSGASSLSPSPLPERLVPFNIISGTSMACPHVAGVAALLKAAYPTWSPAAIKSAIMTTAFTLDNSNETIKRESKEIAGPFEYGAGHIDPNMASSPGLVYDASTEDYHSFFCSLGFTSNQIEMITGNESSCPQSKDTVYNFNYPSISVSALKGRVDVKRTVTYVSEGAAVYAASVKSPPGVSVTVNPSKLTFSKTGEKKSFNLVMIPQTSLGEDYGFGSLTWIHGDHKVTSPIAVKKAVSYYT